MSASLRMLLALLLCAPCTLPAWGQQPTAPPVEAMWQAYQRLDYEAAADSARKALQQIDRYGPDALAEIHTILGLIHYSRNQPAEARRQFASALSLDAALELDPLLVSPKILAFFEEVRAEAGPASPTPGTAAAPVRYVVVQDRRAEAVLRSMVLPGWGQLYKGERTKGAALLGAWGVAAAGAGVTYLRRRQTLRDYEEAGTVEEALARYGPYNRWYRAHRAVLLGAAGLWLYSYVDALIAQGTPPASARLQVIPLSTSAASVRLQVRF